MARPRRIELAGGLYHVTSRGDRSEGIYRAMVGREPAPPWLETDWVLGQFGSGRPSAQAGFARFVAEGVGQGSIWGQLRHQIFLGSDGFIARFAPAAGTAHRLCEIPRAQRRPLSYYAGSYPERREAMARAFLSGSYTMQEIADHFVRDQPNDLLSDTEGDFADANLP
jgi:putative transposase